MEKKNEITFCVKSKYALYSDPLNRVSGEKFSYQIPTYEALKGVVKSIYSSQQSAGLLMKFAL